MGKWNFLSIIVIVLFASLVSSCGTVKVTSITPTSIPTATSTSTPAPLPPPIFTVTPYVSSDEVYLSGNWSPTHNGFHMMTLNEGHPAHIRAVCGGIFTKGKYQNEITGRWQVSTSIDYGSQYLIHYSFEPMGSANDPIPADIQYNLLIADGTRVSAGDVLGQLLVSGEAAHVCFGLSHNNFGLCAMPYFTTAVSAEILAVWRRTNLPGNPICTDHNLYY